MKPLLMLNPTVNTFQYVMEFIWHQVEGLIQEMHYIIMIGHLQLTL